MIDSIAKLWLANTYNMKLEYVTEEIFAKTPILGDKVLFILGNLQGQVIEMPKPYSLDETMDLRKAMILAEPEHPSNRYAIRLPNGTIIRELRVWELEKT